MSNDDRPINRRRFFREGLRELLRPLAGAIEPLAQAAKQLESLDSPPSTWVPPSVPQPPRPETHWLRPPGAGGETEFYSICSRCSECVRVCPVQCIRIDLAGELGRGIPYIDPDAMACVVCDELKCTTSCPTRALQPVPVSDIRMGTAVWREETCARTLGQSCTICIEKCPRGSDAIGLYEGRIEIVPGGCIGCGVCQHECPTSPKSITVTPRAALDAANGM